MSVVHPITTPPAMKVSTSCFWTTVCLPESTPISSDFADHALLDFRHHSQFPTHLPAKSYKSNARMDRDDIFWRAVWSWFQKSYQVDHVATFTKSSPTMYEPFADPYHWRTVYVPTFTLIFSCIINTLLRGSSPYRNGAAPRWRSPWAASSYSKPCEPSCGDAWGGNFVWSCDLISASFRLVKYNPAIYQYIS